MGVEDWQIRRMEISSGITSLVLCLVIVNFDSALTSPLSEPGELSPGGEQQNHLMELSPFSIRLKHPKASLLSSLFDLELRHKKDREKLDSWGLGDMDYPEFVGAPSKRSTACFRGCLKMSSLHPAQCNSLC